MLGFQISVLARQALTLVDQCFYALLKTEDIGFHTGLPSLLFVSTLILGVQWGGVN